MVSSTAHPGRAFHSDLGGLPAGFRIRTRLLLEQSQQGDEGPSKVSQKACHGRFDSAMCPSSGRGSSSDPAVLPSVGFTWRMEPVVPDCD